MTEVWTPRLTFDIKPLLPIERQFPLDNATGLADRGTLGHVSDGMTPN